MPTFYTKAEARAFASRKLQKSFTTDSKRVLREAARSAASHDLFDIFLSHASKDAELILGVKELLEDQGFKVYVDWVEDAQTDRTKVDRENADLLRRRMRQSNSLIWVATSAASESKWMPWELGYFDGFKPNQVAVMPLVDNPGCVFQAKANANSRANRTQFPRQTER
ncbi:toll/interleukin-1 receptor domain-containing protein, partial [Burkholderia ubonensis]|uniref:toll/interleukin-1 receptor domain-containing protein n=1 Tax=Burkholderia ubonensis TaxID=101571 RepID=UPI0009B36672